MRTDYLLGDAQTKQWIRHHRQDLVASNCPIQQTGRFIVFDELVPEGSFVVVKGVVPYAMERIQVGTPAEFAQFIEPIVGNGWFSFEPLVNGGSPFEIFVDVNAPQQAIIASTGVANDPNDKDRARAKGFTDISKEPLRDAGTYWSNPLFSFGVPGGARLQVIFSLLPSAIANPLQGYAIGASVEPPQRRVDFAGCFVVGEIMPETLYRSLVAEERKRGAR